jgi:hypothetical protein
MARERWENASGNAGLASAEKSEFDVFYPSYPSYPKTSLPAKIPPLHLPNYPWHFPPVGRLRTLDPFPAPAALSRRHGPSSPAYLTIEAMSIEVVSTKDSAAGGAVSAGMRRAHVYGDSAEAAKERACI